jgi:hypothetical protein
LAYQPSPIAVAIVMGPEVNAVTFSLTAMTGLRNEYRRPSGPKTEELKTVAACPATLLTPCQKAFDAPPTRVGSWSVN